MKILPQFTRRHFVLTACSAGVAGASALSAPARAAAFRDITWDDLIPPGVPYAEIVAEGAYDEQNDTWKPVFDENATKLNTQLDGQAVRLPGYIIPLDTGSEGVTSFILVPYVGACIHVPPPPPNQLIFVTTDTPWPEPDLWGAIWVSGHLRTQMKSTDIAEIGYLLTAEHIEAYEW